MIEVRLTEPEVTVGATVGLMRRTESLFAARAQTVPGIDADGKGWIHDIEGGARGGRGREAPGPLLGRLDPPGSGGAGSATSRSSRCVTGAASTTT